MIGAIAGDVIGSTYEFNPIKTTKFPLFSEGSRFTDDTVMTLAIASAILGGGDYEGEMRKLGRAHPHAGYGGLFARWLHSQDPRPYNSFGNGSAMRVSPVGFAFNTEEEVLLEAERSAGVTHNHPEGIKGARATALAIFLARSGADKTEIRQQLSKRFGYDLLRTLASIRPSHVFNETCQGSVSEAMIAFLESNSYEDTIRNAVSLGGDSDTQACIAGGVAQAFYGEVPQEIVRETRNRLTPDLLNILDRFEQKFGLKTN